MESQQAYQAWVQASWRAGIKHPDIRMEPAGAFAIGTLLGPRLATWAKPSRARSWSSGRRLVLAVLRQDRQLLVWRPQCFLPHARPGNWAEAVPKEESQGGSEEQPRL